MCPWIEIIQIKIHENFQNQQDLNFNLLIFLLWDMLATQFNKIAINVAWKSSVPAEI